jgi:iron(III) transport system permease protein
MTAVTTRPSAEPAIRAPRIALFPVLTTALVILLVGGPLCFMIFASFRGPLGALPIGNGAFTTLSNYDAVFSRQMANTLRDTGIYVFGSLALTLLVAIPLAFLFERTDLPWRRVFSVLMFAPLLIPPISGAQIWLLLLEPKNGLLNRLIRSVFPFIHTGPFNTSSAFALIFAQGLTFVPIGVLFLGAAFRNVDSALEEASRMSGANALTTTRRVTLRLVLPSIASAALLLCITLLGSFEIPLVFGVGQGLSPIGIRIYQMLNPAGELPYYGQIAAYSVVVTIVGFALIYLYGRLTRSAESFATLTGKGHRAEPLHLGVARWPMFAVVAIFLVLYVGLQLLVLFWQTFVPYVGTISWTTLRRQGSLQAYSDVLGDSTFWAAVRLTAIVALAAALVTTVLAVAMSTVVVRYRGRRAVRAALDMVASTSLSVPSPVAAFAFLTLFLALNRYLPIYGSLGGLIFAYCFRVGYPFRLSMAATVQIGRELEEASSMSGASQFGTLRRVVLPLLAPTVTLVFILGIITAVQEFAVPLFIQSGGQQPLSVYVFDQLGANRPRNAAVVGVLTLIAVLLLAVVAAAISNRLKASGRRA